MNHELHDTLASSIMLLSQALLDAKEKKILLFLKVVQSQLYFTLNFINDINDLKNLTIGNFDPKLKDFDPLNVFKFVTDVFSCQSEISKNQFSFTQVSPKFIKNARQYNMSQLGGYLQGDQGGSRTVHGDETRLRQVLMNLVKSSMKFTV